MSLNLLPTQAKFQAEKIRQKQLVNQILIWSTSIWLLVVVMIFVANFTVGLLAKRSGELYDKAMDNYLSMKDDVQTSQQLKYEAKLVGSSLKTRFEYGKSFELIQSLFPEGINLSTYDLREKGMFELNGSTVGKKNIDTLEQIVTEINNGQKENLSSCKIISLNVKDNLWSFAMEVGIK